jgi:hypothetical protein
MAVSVLIRVRGHPFAYVLLPGRSSKSRPEYLCIPEGLLKPQKKEERNATD